MHMVGRAATHMTGRLDMIVRCCLVHQKRWERQWSSLPLLPVTPLVFGSVKYHSNGIMLLADKETRAGGDAL